MNTIVMPFTTPREIADFAALIAALSSESVRFTARREGARMIIEVQ